MRRHKSNKPWIQQHINDPFVQKAQQEGYRSRAVYKLKEMDEKYQLLKTGMKVVELGAAPGGWTQYLLQHLNDQSTLVAVDLLPMEDLAGMHFIQGDFSEPEILEDIRRYIPQGQVDLLLSDMAPNMSGIATVDIPAAMDLAELVFDFGYTMLRPGGAILIKVFHGAGFEDLVRKARLRFKKVVLRKPSASRPQSRETYLLAKGYNL